MTIDAQLINSCLRGFKNMGLESGVSPGLIQTFLTVR